MPADAQKIQKTLKPLVYVSYAWGDCTEEGKEREQIVDELCEALKKFDGIIVGRDKRRQKIGDSIEDFAADIARADIVLAVVSKKYLRSYHCMVQELHQVYRRADYAREEFSKRVCLLLLDDGTTDISIPKELRDHWNAFYQAEYSKLKELDPDKIGSLHGWAALKDIEDTKSRMRDMLSALTDSVMPRGYAEITRNDFEELRGLISRRLDEWRQWREDRSGLIPEIGEGPMDEPKPDAKRLNHQFLALVLERGEDLLEDTNWAQRECPWEVRSYKWESLLFTPPHDGYRTVDLQADIGSYIVAQAGLISSLPTGAERSTFCDLLQAAVRWIDRQQYSCVLELFVPTELLVFDWSAIMICGKTDYDDDEYLFERHPYVLRSVERFSEEQLALQRSQLPKKYASLKADEGQWIAGPAAADLTKLRESETNPERVALKLVSLLDPDPLKRLRWHRRVVETMVPLALWWRVSEAGSQDEQDERHSYLDEAYKGLLSGHSDGDPVPMDCHHLEKLPCLRRSAISNPFTKDLVLMVDHPDRHPWPQTSPIHSA